MDLARRWVLVLGLGLLAVGASCARGESTEGSVLDGRPRHPDIAGIVGTVTRERIEIDDKSYEFAETVESFSTYDGQLSSVFDRRGQYVHAGLADGAVRWVAAVGLPSGSPARVYFGSEVTARAGRVLTFSGGTVLELADGVDAPSRGEIEVFIDVTSDEVVEVRAL